MLVVLPPIIPHALVWLSTTTSHQHNHTAIISRCCVSSRFNLQNRDLLHVFLPTRLSRCVLACVEALLIQHAKRAVAETPAVVVSVTPGQGSLRIEYPQNNTHAHKHYVHFLTCLLASLVAFLGANSVCINIFALTVLFSSIQLPPGSNHVDSTKGLAHFVVRRSNVHERRAVCHSAHARHKHLDAPNQICSTTGPRHVRVSGKCRLNPFTLLCVSAQTTYWNNSSQHLADHFNLQLLHQAMRAVVVSAKTTSSCYFSL